MDLYQSHCNFKSHKKSSFLAISSQSPFTFSRTGPNSHPTKSKSESKLCYDRRSVGQSVLVSSTHLGLTITFLLLPVAGLLMWGALSDERTGLTFIKLLLALASAVILGSESRETHDRILLSQIRDFPNLELQVPVIISLRNTVT
jgi:hypothetical protein